MINYCFDYFKVEDTWVDEGTLICSSRTERTNTLNEFIEEGYTIAHIYENEDCYCGAYYEGECACGNFK